MVGRHSGMFGSGRVTVWEVRKCSGHLPGGPEVVRRPSGRSGNGRETLREVLKCS